MLSIILPAHNEEHRLPPSLAKIDAFLQQQPYEAEVIVVENGSADRTAEVTRAFAKDHPYVRLLEGETRGKGRAVRQGMLAATGAWRFMCDVDLSMPIEEIVNFLPPNTDGYDVLIGSREAPGSKRIDEPERRHIMGRVLNWIIKLALMRDFEDTQCGFKMFSGPVADDLFGVQRMEGIGFDAELLFVALKRGYPVREVPITWYFDPDSKMKLWDDTIKILREIWEIRQNWRKGLYDDHRPQRAGHPAEG